MKKLKLMASCLLVVGSCVGTSAFAQSAMKASANLSSTCSISMTNVDFGNFDFNQGYMRVNHSIEVKCSKSTGYQITNNRTHYYPMSGTGSNTDKLYSVILHASGPFSGHAFASDQTYSTIYGTGNGAVQTIPLTVDAYNANKRVVPDVYTVDYTFTLTF